jgi:integrase
MMTFNSNYSDLIKDYITFKQSLGYAMSNQYHWRDIDRFLLASGEQVSELGITENQFHTWYKKRPNETPRNQYDRACRLRNFSAYLKLLGYDSFHPSHITVPQKKFVPYIFSHDEMERIFAAADSIRSRNAAGSKELSSAIFRILYATGIRVGELTALRLGDIALLNTIPHFKIVNTKTKQDRLVALSPSAAEALRCYLSIRPSSALEAVFLNFKKHPITQGTIYTWFRQILFGANIAHQGKGRGPRVHDLRHTFAVHSLHQMHEQGMDLYCCLPILSKYLGHASLGSTDAYVRLTAEMYPEVLENMSIVSRLIFPEVYDEA